MKKIVIIIAIIIGILAMKKDTLPEDTIRFRIIANSNNVEDQETKKKIVKSMEKELQNRNAKTKEEEEKYIKEMIPTFENRISNEIGTPFQIHYGENYFPEKEYQGKTYEAGMYESLVITLGEGRGDNFWCILFPPLCMIEEEEPVEYKSWIKEAISKLF